MDDSDKTEQWVEYEITIKVEPSQEGNNLKLIKRLLPTITGFDNNSNVIVPAMRELTVKIFEKLVTTYWKGIIC